MDTIGFQDALCRRLLVEDVGRGFALLLCMRCTDTIKKEASPPLEKNSINDRAMSNIIVKDLSVAVVKYSSVS